MMQPIFFHDVKHFMSLFGHALPFVINGAQLEVAYCRGKDTIEPRQRQTVRYGGTQIVHPEFMYTA